MAGDLELARLQGADPAERALGALDPAENILAFLEKEMRLGGGGELALHAHEEGKTQLILERADHGRDRRLRAPDAARRLADRAGAHDLSEGGELAQGEMHIAP